MAIKLPIAVVATIISLTSLCADDARDIECSIMVDADKVRFPVAPDMWGIFFEDIDLSLDGGIYAEMVRNRSFEEGRLAREQNEPLAWWDPVGAAYLSADVSKPLSGRNARCVRVEARPGAGIANQGYFGMNVEKGKRRWGCVLIAYKRREVVMCRYAERWRKVSCLSGFGRCLIVVH